MSDIVDNLLTRHYAAHVMRKGDVEVVLNDMRAAIEDPDIKLELDRRHSAIQNIKLSDTDLSQRDFSAFVELVALRKILT